MARGDLLCVTEKNSQNQMRQYRHCIDNGNGHVWYINYSYKQNDITFLSPKLQLVSLKEFVKNGKVSLVKLAKDIPSSKEVGSILERIQNKRVDSVYKEVMAQPFWKYVQFNERHDPYLDQELFYSVMLYYRTGELFSYRGGLIFKKFMFDPLTIEANFRISSFTHWGIFDGKESVYHYCPPNFFVGTSHQQQLESFKKGMKTIVEGIRFQKTSLNDFTNNLKKNLNLEYVECDHPELVMERAEQLTKMEVLKIAPEQSGKNDYQIIQQLTWNLFLRNCEHSARWCRTGKEWSSGQVGEAIKNIARIWIRSLPPEKSRIVVRNLKNIGIDLFDYRTDIMPWNKLGK